MGCIKQISQEVFITVDNIFSCDSSSIRDNVRLSVGWSVGRSIRTSPTSFKVCVRLSKYVHTHYKALNTISRRLA